MDQILHRHNNRKKRQVTAPTQKAGFRASSDSIFIKESLYLRNQVLW